MIDLAYLAILAIVMLFTGVKTLKSIVLISAFSSFFSFLVSLSLTPQVKQRLVQVIKQKVISTRLIAIIVSILLSACATLHPNFEAPQVSVNSFKVLPDGGLNPTFEIGLRVVNPNSISLNLKGLSYTASIEGNQIVSGVANQLPAVPAYGEEDIKLHAQADLFGGLRLIADLMKKRITPISYTLKVKMDVSTFALPIYITREGNLTIPTAD
jgi:LEA14-like dessication related protein